jgi:hypothetical protein
MRKRRLRYDLAKLLEGASMGETLYARTPMRMADPDVGRR